MIDSEISEEHSLKDNDLIRSIKPKFRSIHRTMADEDTQEQASQTDSSRYELNRSVTTKNSFTFVRISISPGRWIAIPLKDKYMTGGWLLSEVIRKLTTLNVEFEPSDVIGFRSDNIHLDYHLSCLHWTLPELDGKVLSLLIRGKLMEPVNLQWFEIVRKLAAGGFSIVYLVRNLHNGQFYAMKVIDKRLMIERDKEEMIFNERMILSRVNHPKVIALHYAFQTKQKLYFIFDYCPGGELFFHLRKNKRFPEDQAKWLFKSILEGIAYLHKQNIIYRDLKPENILIDQDGLPKIADFGLSKIVKTHDQLNYSFCGSLEYMAPEMIEQSGHNKTLDFYQLGVLLYELVAGIPPFYAKTRQDMVKNIVSKTINFPYFFSKPLQNLIQKLCHKNKQQRLSNVTEILQHPWCQGLTKKMPIKYSLSDFNFDKMFTNQKCDNIESGPRCISEEFHLKLSQTQNDEEDDPYEHFSSFYFKK